MDYYSPEHVEISMILTELGINYRDMDNRAEAELHFKQALNMRLKCLGKFARDNIRHSYV